MARGDAADRRHTTAAAGTQDRATTRRQFLVGAGATVALSVGVTNAARLSGEAAPVPEIDRATSPYGETIRLAPGEYRAFKLDVPEGDEMDVGVRIQSLRRREEFRAPRFDVYGFTADQFAAYERAVETGGSLPDHDHRYTWLNTRDVDHYHEDIGGHTVYLVVDNTSLADTQPDEFPLGVDLTLTIEQHLDY